MKVAFIGNPNVGKTALINNLAGANLKVGNWAGVTVEKKEAEFMYNGKKIYLIDLPGVYSLSPYTLEEKITRDYIIEENPDVIVNVVDITNLERNLYLTMQLKELGKPMLLVMNFYDEFEKLGYRIDEERFSKLMEMDIIKTVAVKKQGFDELMKKIEYSAEAHKESKRVKYEVRFDQTIEREIETLKCMILKDSKFDLVRKDLPIEWMAIKFLEKDSYFLENLEKKYKIDAKDFAKQEIKKTENIFYEDAETVLTEGRYAAIKGILENTLKKTMKSRLDFTDKVDKILLNKFLGIIVFFILMYLVFVFTFEGSAPFIDWVDGFINAYIGKYVAMAIEGVPHWLNSLIMDGIIAGVGGVLVFVPLMMFLFFFLSILEESGYMARVAFLMDKLMRKLGLNGKAFLPLILGFGCSVPAIYATRTMEDEKSKRLTAVMTPFMSCGARMPVYALFTAVFFKENKGLVVLSLYLLGVLVAVSIGLILKKTPAFKAAEEDLLIELPPYRMPTFNMIWRSLTKKTMSYVQKAATVILGVMIILWVFMYFPQGDNEKLNLAQRTEKSYLGQVSKFISPVFKPTGFGDNWQMVASVGPSIIAKEVVVAFLGQAFGFESAEEEKEKTSFLEDTKVQVIGLFVAVKDSVKTMITFKTGAFEVQGVEEVEEEVGGLLDSLKKVMNPLSAYSFMVFILLVVPCVVTLASIKHEFGYGLMTFQIVLMTVVPWLASTLVYQIGRIFIN